MVYEVCISEIRYGRVFVEADTEDGAEDKVYSDSETQERINWHSSEYSDVVATEYGLPKCSRCGTEVRLEAEPMESKYPFYCPNCDENMFEFETEQENDCYKCEWITTDCRHCKLSQIHFPTGRQCGLYKRRAVCQSA